jgi:MFS family permease
VTLTAGQKTSLAMGILGVSYTLGLIAGPLIGGAFAITEHATWRWVGEVFLS